MSVKKTCFWFILAALFITSSCVTFSFGAQCTGRVVDGIVTVEGVQTRDYRLYLLPNYDKALVSDMEAYLIDGGKGTEVYSIQRSALFEGFGFLFRKERYLPLISPGVEPAGAWRSGVLRKGGQVEFKTVTRKTVSFEVIDSELDN